MAVLDPERTCERRPESSGRCQALISSRRDEYGRAIAVASTTSLIGLRPPSSLLYPGLPRNAPIPVASAREHYRFVLDRPLADLLSEPQRTGSINCQIREMTDDHAFPGPLPGGCPR